MSTNAIPARHAHSASGGAGPRSLLRLRPRGFDDSSGRGGPQRGPAAVGGGDKVSSLMSGNGADVHDAMIAVEKADLQFQLMVQVRNKVVQAYQQIAGMQF